jgi:hypothetical protein
MAPKATNPVETSDQRVERDLVIAPAYLDGATGALWVHKDYVPVRKDWEDEAHRSPASDDVAFGDVESWAQYVTRYGYPERALLTWNGKGLKAVLDYHRADEHELGGRRQWMARYPFFQSPELQAWVAFAGGQAHSQREAIERLEDLGEDIKEPSQAELTTLLRNLRANVSSEAETTLREDGTSAVSWKQDKTLKAGGTTELPPFITIGIPLLVGHPERYALRVRVRVSVDDRAHLALRFSLVNADRSLEDVYAQRVEAARALLGEAFTLLRAAN